MAAFGARELIDAVFRRSHILQGLRPTMAAKLRPARFQPRPLWLLLVLSVPGLAGPGEEPAHPDLPQPRAVTGGIGSATPAEAAFEAAARPVPDRGSISAGEEFDLLLELTCRGESLRVEMGPIPSLELTSNLRVLRTASGNRRRRADENVTEIHFYRYTLVAVEPGEGRVYPAELQYRPVGEDGFRSLRTPEVSVTITPALDARPPLWQKVAVVTAPLVAALLVAAGLRRRSRKHRKPAAERTPQPRWMLELEEAKRKRYEGDARAYLDALAAALRSGLAEKTGLEGRPGLSAVRRRLADAPPGQPSRRRALELVEECERTRYAPEIPPVEDLDRLAKRIQELLEAWEDPR